MSQLIAARAIAGIGGGGMSTWVVKINVDACEVDFVQRILYYHVGYRPTEIQRDVAR